MRKGRGFSLPSWHWRLGARAGGSPRESVTRNLHLFVGTSAFLSSGGPSKTVFVIPGDYSTASEEPGGHKLDPLASDLSVESDFMFDQATQETVLVVGSKVGASTNAAIGLTLYGHSTRLVSERELLAALVRNGRAVLHINFNFDKSTLRPDAMPAIDQVTALLKDNPSLGLQIEGHTDEQLLAPPPARKDDDPMANLLGATRAPFRARWWDRWADRPRARSSRPRLPTIMPPATTPGRSTMRRRRSRPV